MNGYNMKTHIKIQLNMGLSVRSFNKISKNVFNNK